MWTKKTAGKLRAKMARLYEKLADCHASGNIKMYLEGFDRGLM
jgi:hypothetical protein